MRRNDIALLTPAEVAIGNAVSLIEKMPADERLTNAQIKLMEAQQLVADFVDEAITRS